MGDGQSPEHKGSGSQGKNFVCVIQEGKPLDSTQPALESTQQDDSIILVGVMRSDRIRNSFGR